MVVLFGDPFDALYQFQQALDHLRQSDWLDAGPSGQGSYPPLNVFRKGEDVVIITEVPGVKKADLRIEAKGNTLRIAGSKATGIEGKAGVHRIERRGGTFDRAISLPIEIDVDSIKAECRDGILALFIPRAERDKPRSISVS